MFKQRLGSLTRLTIWLLSALAYALWMVVGIHRYGLVNEVLGNTAEIVLLSRSC